MLPVSGDDDGMVLLESEEDADLVIGVDQSPEGKPATEKPTYLETWIAEDLSPCNSPVASHATSLSIAAHLSPKVPSPPGLVVSEPAWVQAAASRVC